MFTAIGDDAYGEAGRELWKAEGVGADKVAVTTAATMCGFIMVEPSGENRIVLAQGALTDVTAADIGQFAEELAAADVCVVSLEIAIDVAVEALQRAHAAGTRTVLNPAPAAVLPEAVWTAVDFITPNRSEAAMLGGLTPDAGENDLVGGLRKLTDAVIVMTLGEAGALVDHGRSRMRYPGRSVEGVVDTTGAGDAFSAASRRAWQRGWLWAMPWNSQTPQGRMR